MDQELYISLNGIQMQADKAVLNVNNRSFRYGDALFETIRCIQQKPMWFHDHYQRLINGMSLLQMDIKSLPPATVLEEHICALIQKNRLFGDVRVRLTVFREDGGLYTPANNKVQWLVEASALNTHNYELNTKGLLIDIFEDEKKPLNRFGQYKTANALLFVLAGLFKQQEGKDDVLIINSNNQIIEGLASNLFWVKNNEFYTPLRSSGCVNGVMRRQIIRLLRDNNWPIHEVSATDYDTLLQADEIFLSNAIQGIQWVVGLRDKRYFCKLSKKVNRLLVEAATSYTKDFQEN